MTAIDYPRVVKDSGLSDGLLKVLAAIADTFAPALSQQDARDIAGAHFARLRAYGATNLPSDQDVMAFLTCPAAADMSVKDDLVRNFSTQIAPFSFFKLSLVLWALSTSLGNRGKLIDF